MVIICPERNIPSGQVPDNIILLCLQLYQYYTIFASICEPNRIYVAVSGKIPWARRPQGYYNDNSVGNETIPGEARCAPPATGTRTTPPEYKLRWPWHQQIRPHFSRSSYPPATGLNFFKSPCVLLLNSPSPTPRLLSS